MVLQGEGGEEAGEAGDEATEDGGETDGLPPAVGDGEGREEEGDGDRETAQHTCREHSREAGQSGIYRVSQKMWDTGKEIKETDHHLNII